MPRPTQNTSSIEEPQLKLNDPSNISIVIGSNAAGFRIDKTIGNNAFIGHGAAEVVGTITEETKSTAIGSGAIKANTDICNSILVPNALSAAGSATANATFGFECVSNCTGGETSVVGY